MLLGAVFVGVEPGRQIEAEVRDCEIHDHSLVLVLTVAGQRPAGSFPFKRASPTPGREGLSNQKGVNLLNGPVQANQGAGQMKAR